MGKIEIDHTGSGGGVTLSSDGTSLLLGGTAIGGGGASAYTIDNKTAAYTVVSGDLGKIINCTTNTFTVSLTAAATLGAGFNVTIWNTSSTTAHVITIDPNGAETIDGKSTINIQRGGGVEIICDGANWQVSSQRYLKAIGSNPNPVNNYPIATGQNSLAFGMGTTSSGDTSIAIGGAAVSSGILSLATQGSTASASRSTAIGQNSSNQGSQAVTGSGAMALGGSYASGTDSFAAAIANNTSSYGATGANSVAIGKWSKSTNSYAVSLGYLNSSTGLFSTSIGTTNTASAQYSFTLGTRAVASIKGKMAYASGEFSSNGDAQLGTTVLRNDSTSATAEVLTTDTLTASTDNQVILPNNSAFAFHGTIVARQQAAGGTASAAWKIEGLIRREGSAGTTVLVNSATTVLDNTPSWGMALSADTTNGGLAITVTGAASTNIRWVATIHTSEVTYA